MDKELKCSICGKPILSDPSEWEHGNDADPVNDGRCCTTCDWEVVIPARIRQMFATKKKQEE